MTDLDAETLVRRFHRARARRRGWESFWRECYEYALPQRDGALVPGQPGERKTDHLFDGTAPDAVDQLAASMLAELTPAWSRWFALRPGPQVGAAEARALSPHLREAEEILQAEFDRSNFVVEMHQGFLDLVCVGTASLLFDEAAPGAPSAFRFAAVPLGQAVLEEGPDGRLDITYRHSELTSEEVARRFPEAGPLERDAASPEAEPRRYGVIEAVIPDGAAYDYLAVLEEQGVAEEAARVLARGRFGRSPFVNFRWLKAPGEAYGRSPVMKALPDIKTANKVVELVLKNASIAATGIWQADDDGVLNPATVRLTPGTIIPKAVGSSGLTPLAPPGQFDVSELVLQDLRARIRHALLADRLGQVNGPRMSATEVLERSAEMARLLGATYGRLQTELLTPLLRRALSILVRRGRLPEVVLDSDLVEVAHRSPLAQAQARQEVQNVLLWLEGLAQFGPEALAAVDLQEATRWFARALGVPGELLRDPATTVTATATAIPAGGADDILR
jgi:hypothetical protein